MRLVLLMMILSLLVVGARGDDYEEAYRLRERAEILPLEQLLGGLNLGPDARILEIESEREHGRHVYEIEYLDRGGRVRKALIDAGSGEVLSDREDD